jgi:hypothetical protein
LHPLAAQPIAEEASPQTGVCGSVTCRQTMLRPASNPSGSGVRRMIHQSALEAIQAPALRSS